MVPSFRKPRKLGQPFFVVVRRELKVGQPAGLDTTVIVFFNNPEHTGFVGEHTALFVTNNGEPVLYDPSGDARINGFHPDNDIFQGEDADLNQYLGSHNSANQGTYAELFTFDTTPDQEKEIVARIKALGHQGSFNCADSVSRALQGIGPFKGLGHYYRPAALAKQLGELELPVLPRIALRRLIPVPPSNWQEIQ